MGSRWFLANGPEIRLSPHGGTIETLNGHQNVMQDVNMAFEDKKVIINKQKCWYHCPLGNAVEGL